MDVLRSTRPGPALLASIVLLVAQFGGAAASEGAPLDLQQYRGKVVVLDFWASWCVPCRRSFPWMNSMQEKYASEGLVIVGVNMDSSAEDAQAFLREYPARFTIVSDAGGNLARQFGVEAMPSSYVIGRDGAIVATHLGFQVKKVDEYEANIRQVLLSSED